MFNACGTVFTNITPADIARWTQPNSNKPAPKSMPSSPYIPLYKLTRGKTDESFHFGALAVVDAENNLIASAGDPAAITFLRSSAKPLQALPLIERGGASAFDLTAAEIAVMCASHSGTDKHAATVQAIQAKIGASEADLLCGVHPVGDEETAQAMQRRGELPTPNRHNCSGKHTGMLAQARLLGLPIAEYINPAHPVQQIILETFAAMCGLAPEQVETGIDGCSAPNFAVSLQAAALAYARLCDPQNGRVSPPARAAACQIIVSAMMSHPEMVGGPGRFDTRLMEVARGRLIAKGGAEGYQAIGVLPGATAVGSPALGIAVKISDGDSRGAARAAVALEVLSQLGVLTSAELETLSVFGPCLTTLNWRQLRVGEALPVFQVEKS
jgi:L-asparaginase II